jgi:hypothetical protein
MTLNPKFLPVFLTAIYFFGAHAADMSLIDSFPGVYKGEAALGIGNLAETGYLKVTKMGNSLTISCWSDSKQNLIQTFFIDEIAKYFTMKKKSVPLSNGILEERVSFQMYEDDDYFLLNKWSEEVIQAQTVWTYQFKFHKKNLVGLRVQEYHTAHKEKLTYLLELRNLNKMRNQKMNPL